MMVLTSSGPAPLTRILAGLERGLADDMGTFLRIACGLATALRELHARGVVHRDIKPANVVADVGDGGVALTGFDPASRPASEPPELVAGTLPYMAPEQTGRTNRSVDSRSDLYAVGVTLYELLAGRLPFDARDAAEWMHCHVARIPERPPGPPIVASIVMRLLQKAPEDRYQSARGLEHDLRRCLASWQLHGKLEEFTLAAHDVPERFVPAAGLFGREGELALLVATHDRVKNTGRSELVLLSGPAGIGKSALVHAFLAHCPLFAEGKVDQLQRELPYAAVAQAFRALALPLLGRPAAEVAAMREALGDKAPVLASIVPEVSVLVSATPPAVEVSVDDQKRRARAALAGFLRLFTRRGEPLVLFLDDLQWADAATLELIPDLLAEPHLLLIGAHRDETADDLRILDDVRAGAVQRLALAPLAAEDLTRWLATSLHARAERTEALARVVHDRTGGNAFFAQQFARTLVDEGVVHQGDDGEWTWDLAKVAAQPLTDNVVDLMVSALQRLAPETQEALRVMACVGNTASAALLEKLVGPAGLAALDGAAELRLIDRRNEVYGFAHDRVQEAAYSTIPEPERPAIHARIGRLLVGEDNALFQTVRHLSLGSSFLVSLEERFRLAELELEAARRARGATAYSSEHAYIAAARAHLPDDAWLRRRDLAFAIELEHAGADLRTGALEDAEQRLIELWPRATTSAERAAIACHQLDVCLALARPTSGIGVALEYLRSTGIDIPEQPTDDDVGRAYARVRPRLEDSGRLLELPDMADPESLATLDVVAHLLTPAYLTQPNLHALLVLLAVELSLEGGLAAPNCPALVHFGWIAADRFGDVELGYRVAKVGFDLVELRGFRQVMTSTYATYIVFWLPLGMPLHAQIPELRRLVALFQDAGDFATMQHYGPNLGNRLLAAGRPLDEIEAELATHVGRASGTPLDMMLAVLGLVRTLRGKTRALGAFDDDGFDEHAFAHRLTSNPELALGAFWYALYKLEACVLAGDTSTALVTVELVERYYPAFRALTVTAPKVELYVALARAATGDRAALPGHLARIQQWVARCPEAFAEAEALVAAEIARLDGRDLEAMRLYEDAIEAARRNGLVHHEALASEIAARFYSARRFPDIAGTYLQKARDAYRRWGADAKVRQLEAMFPRDLATAHSVTAPTISASAQTLDLDTVLKVSRSISSELAPERLVDELMRTALEHAGADRGVLLLGTVDALEVCGEATTTLAGVDVRLASGAAVPETVVTCAARVRERVAIDDVQRAHAFSADPYFASPRARSIVCLPLVKQAALVGVLYLENTLAAHSFTAARMSVLTVIAAEAALALDHSRLYREVAERESRFRALFDCSLIGMWIANADRAQPISEANDAFLAMLGYSRQDLAAGRLDSPKLTPPDRTAAVERAISQVLSRGSCDIFENELLRKDGSRIPVLVGGALMKGSPRQIVAFILDLTDRKRAEEERERARRLEMERETAIVTERTRLAAEVHDSLAQGLALIVMQLADADAKLGSARSAAEKQLNLVRELAIESLSYARRSVNVLRPGIVAGGLPRAIRDIVDSVRRHFAGAMPLAITGDAMRLDIAVESVFASIAREALTNAARHSGAVRVETELEYTTDGTVRLAVRDDGAGFDTSTVRSDGFGLVSMRERAARAGVALTIITEPGAGTEVVASYTAVALPRSS